MKINFNHIFSPDKIGFTILLTICLWTFSGSAIAKTDAGTLALTKADMYYKVYKYAQAAQLYEDYLKKNTVTNPDVQLKLADCYWNMRRYSYALSAYENALQKGVVLNSDKDIIRLAELYARSEEYSKASEWLSKISVYSDKAGAFASTTAIAGMKSDSAAWHINLLNINTQYREFSPVVADNSLLFSSNKPLNAKTKAFGWDGLNFLRLWKVPLKDIDTFSAKITTDSLSDLKIDETTFKNIADVYECGDTKSNVNINRILVRNLELNGDANPIGAVVAGVEKLKFNAGSISVDKHNHIYFSANYNKPAKDNVNRIRLMEGVYKDGAVTDVKVLPFGDSKSFSAMHPAVNTDGTIIVFASDKKGGVGAYDLYFATRSDVNSEWGEATLLKSGVNTHGNEVFPVISNDNFLYFSSDALPGLGGLDIYKISLTSAINGTDSPAHLSYPINSSSDDFGFYRTDDKSGFLSSDRLNNDDNIYSYSYIVPLNGKFFVTGKVLDESTAEPISNATVFVYDVKSGKVHVTKTRADGSYTYGPIQNPDIVVKAIAKNRTPDCTTKTLAIKPLSKDTTVSVSALLLKSLMPAGDKLQIDYIHYDFDKHFIRADARPILDSVVKILNKYPINVELASHTDSRGSNLYNEKLSQRRADAAVAYLIKKGIDASRITAKGYGENQLLNKCADGIRCTEKEHQANRRTEVKIIGLSSNAPDTGVNPDLYTEGQVLDVKELPQGFFDNCR